MAEQFGWWRKGDLDGFFALLVGNIFYAFQARALAQRTGQAYVTALPYGVNTISLFAYILFVMKPVPDQTNDVELRGRSA